MAVKSPNALLHGTLDVLVLKTLTGGPRHGYAIARFIEDTTGDAVLVEEGSPYPALYRMERRGWVDAEWGTFRAVMVVTFAGLALLLAMVGVFGILAYSVQQRVRDFAVRRALGATSGDVLRMVVASAIRVIGSGAIIGLLALSAALGRLLTAMLFGVEPLDPATFACVTILLIVTAAMSIAGPAWRATRINPAAALRTE